MSKESMARYAMLALRLSLGWLFLYAGWTKIMNPSWSAAGYLQSAKTFTPFYQWLASPDLLPITDFVNQWALFLVGLCLIIGFRVRIASFVGALLMLLYYFPILDGFRPNEHALIVDEHIIYSAGFLVLAMHAHDARWCASLFARVRIGRRR